MAERAASSAAAHAPRNSKRATMAKPRIIERRMKEPEPVRFESLQAMARLSIGSGCPRTRLPRGVAKKSLQCLTGDTLGRPAFVAQASEMVLNPKPASG